MSIRKRNLHSDLQNWVRQQGMGYLGFMSDGPISGTVGKTYYVNGNGGSDSDHGEAPDHPFDTLAKAIGIVNGRIDWAGSPWATHDIIVVYPGVYAENLTSLPYGATILCLGYDNRDAQLGVKVKPAAGAPVDVNSLINSTILNMGFESPDATAAFDAAVCNNNFLINCWFSGAAESVTCAAAFTTTDMVRTKLLGCDITCAAKGIWFNYVDAGDSISHCVVDDTLIHQCTVGIEAETNLVGPSTVIRNSDLFSGGQTMSTGVLDSAGILQLSRLNITATDPVNGCRAANGCYGNGALLDSTGE